MTFKLLSSYHFNYSHGGKCPLIGKEHEIMMVSIPLTNSSKVLVCEQLIYSFRLGVGWSGVES